MHISNFKQEITDVSLCIYRECTYEASLVAIGNNFNKVDLGNKRKQAADHIHTCET